jgi:hypothetical protein
VGKLRAEERRRYIWGNESKEIYDSGGDLLIDDALSRLNELSEK